MKTIISVIFVSTIGLAGFQQPNLENPEQIAFDYFISDIIKDDFKGLSTIEFKGKTEENYSVLGDYKFCLTPERLGPIIKSVTTGQTQMEAKSIQHKPINEISINKFTDNDSTPKLYLYRSAHVADSYYVFLTLKLPRQSAINYLFEITHEGKISRSCKAG